MTRAPSALNQEGRYRERETGESATPEQLKDARDEAESRVDNYLKGWSGKG